MRRALVLLLLLPACGKTDLGPRIEWKPLAQGEREARATNKPLLVFVGADWDTAAKQLEHVTFRDPRVRVHVAKNFVTAYSDMTDDERPQTMAERDRLLVIGTPAVIIRTPDGKGEVGIVNSFVKPEELIAFLDRCLVRWREGRAVPDRPYGREPRAYDCR